MSHRLFLYGTLCDPELFRIVAGEPFDPRPALLSDHASVWAADESFPLIIREPGATIRKPLLSLANSSFISSVVYGIS